MSDPRPRLLVLVAGTTTGVGKTWWTAQLARQLKAAGHAVAVRKPAQSRQPGETPDSEVLAAASGESPDRVTPRHRTYRVPWAPPMAADEMGLSAFTVADLARELEWPASVDVGLVEGAGGPRSPIAHDGDNVDLARLLAPDALVLVGDSGLGTINAVRLSVDALAGHTLHVALNRYRDDSRLHVRNRATLEADGLSVVTTPAALGERLTGSEPERKPGTSV